jgi:geranylgeranylglycerol-phosphate geranylgeranyltransferase
VIEFKSLVNRLFAMVRLTRPINCLSALIGTLIGGLIVSKPMTPKLLLASLIAGIITASGNILNDYFDIEIDRINKPDRVLPSGRVSLKSALWAGLGLAFAAVLLGFSLGLKMSLFTLAMAFFAFYYSWRLKKTYLLGNIVVSLLSGLTFLYGSLVYHQIGHAWLPGLIVFLFMLDRELLKTVEDEKGDRVNGARTMSVQIGRANTLRVFVFLTFLVALVVPLPWFMQDVSILYLILTLPLVSAVLLMIAFMVRQPPTLVKVKRILWVMKGTWMVWAISTFMGVLLRPL